MDNAIIYREIQYKWKKDNFILSDVTYLDANENKNANTGQAKASVYCIGHQ